MDTVWTKFLQEAFDAFSKDEPIEAFRQRMEQAGYSLDYRAPGACKDLSDIAFVQQVTGHLNVTAGTNYRSKVPSANATCILARRKEGYRIEEFFAVIDKKTAAWKGTQMEVHLNPETLFSRKHFDNYLGQKAVNGQVTSAPKTGFEQLNESMARAKGTI